MATVPSSPTSSVPSKHTSACVRCAERKVKCNRQRPCSACLNHKVDCVFQPPRPPQRRQRHVNNQILTDRLRYYETLLQEKGIDTRKLSDTPQVVPQQKPNQPVVATKEPDQQTPGSFESEPSGNVSKTQVIHGQGRSMFVENSLWSRVVEEFHDPEDALEECSSDLSDLGTSDNDFIFVLSSRPKSKNRPRHPPPETILQLWETYIENFDPLTKVVHVPTFTPAIQKAVNNIETIPRSFEALMFAIYGGAVLSLNDDDCKQKFGEPRKTLLSRYINATKAALSRARFMETTTLVTLQALVLHLVSVRDIYEPRAVWSLTGVAVRIAQGMGLERDGVFLGLSPFETEMRRRLWWLLKTHDHRTAELCGLSKFRDLIMGPESTKWPSNVNDDQLYPGMAAFPAESKTLSDSAFVALRYELVSFAAGRVAKFRQQGKSPSQWDRDLASGDDKMKTDEALEEMEAFLGMKYLRHCDPSQPLHLLTMLMARAAVNTIRFLTHHPRRWASIQQTPSSERQWVWDISINLLEQYSMLHSNPLLKRFAWHVAYVMQWHVFIHVLDTLRANPLIPDADKVWQIVGSTFEGYPAMVTDTGKTIHVAVGNLCLKAYNARSAALQQNNRSLPPMPDFVLKLCQQQEIARAKRQARDTKIIQAEDGNIHGRVKSHRTDAGINSSNTLQPSHLPLSATSQSPHIAQIGSGMIETDPFWHVNGLDESRIGSFNDMMDMDLDLMLGQDHGIDDNASHTINWEQWDTWLADSNAILPLSSARGLGAGA